MCCGGLERGMEIMVREELCEKVVEVRDVGMTVVADLEEDVLRLISWCGLHCGRCLEEKQCFL